LSGPSGTSGISGGAFTYQPNYLVYTVNGSQIQSSGDWQFSSGDLYSCTKYIKTANGSGSTPSHTFCNDTTTGMFLQSSTNHNIGFALNGTEMFRMVNNSGYGDFHATANIIGYSSTPSDERLKDNIQNITNGLEIIEQLRPVSYTWKDIMKRGNDFGLIAQEVEKVLPELIYETEMIQTKNDEKYKTLSYERLVPFLIQSIQELNNKIKELEKK
jgi:hypothetical protein